MRWFVLCGYDCWMVHVCTPTYSLHRGEPTHGSGQAAKGVTPPEHSPMSARSTSPEDTPSITSSSNVSTPSGTPTKKGKAHRIKSAVGKIIPFRRVKTSEAHSNYKISPNHSWNRNRKHSMDIASSRWLLKSIEIAITSEDWYARHLVQVPSIDM